MGLKPRFIELAGTLPKTIDVDAGLVWEGQGSIHDIRMRVALIACIMAEAQEIIAQWLAGSVAAAA